MADLAKPGAPVSPVHSHVGEHGVWGYDNDNPVGGFGEDYDAQVARGSEPLANATHEDAELAHAVQKGLASAHVDAADLRVDVHGSVVTLFGSVRQASEKAQLESRARAVPGVSSVTSKLTVTNGATHTP